MTDIEILNNKINELESKVAELEKKKISAMNQSAECEICHKIFKNKYILNTHMKNIHCERRETFECPYCKKPLKSKYFLQYHIQHQHNNEKQ